MNQNIIREMPDSKIVSLRFQVGRDRNRNMINPAGFPNEQMMHAFHLLGWGDTLEKAEKMAARNLPTSICNT